MEKQTVYIKLRDTISDCMDSLLKLGIFEKKENVYVFTPEELLERDKQKAGDAFEKGWRRGHADGADILDITSYDDKEKYLNNLKP